MANAPVYKSFEEKAEHFNLVKIDTMSKFEEMLKMQEAEKGIYRGISNSKYKIYTSLQRRIIADEIGGFDLTKYLKKIREDKILKKYFKAFNILPTNLALYSFFQHYHAPTPLIDFSTDLLKSMYFALENFEISTYIEGNSIDNYFSVFFINQEDTKLLQIDNVLDYQKKTKQFVEDVYKSYGESLNDDYVAEYLDTHLGINTMEIFMIDQRDEFAEVYNTYNNIRIIAQDGLFIHNSFPDKPLEEALKEFFIDATQYTASVLDDLSDPMSLRIVSENREQVEKNRIAQARLEENIITSFEIKKSLIPEIKKDYTLTKGDIYPDPIDICDKIFRESV